MTLAILAGGVLAAGVLLAIWGRGRAHRRCDAWGIATAIESFLDGTCGQGDWDDFISLPISDPKLDDIRRRCRALSAESPPKEPGHYCGRAGFEVLRRFVRELREESA